MPTLAPSRRRRALALSLGTLCAAALAMGSAQAADQRVVTLLVPYPAGGLSDSIARALNTALGRALNQQVIVDNLGGVSGSLAAQKVLNAPADGHMIFLGSPNEVILSPMVNAAVKLRAEDFRMLGLVSVNPLVLLTRATLPVGVPTAAYTVRLHRYKEVRSAMVGLRMDKI